MKAIVDHNGQEFKSIVEMCKFHNIGYRVFLRRLERGHSMEEALTMPVLKRPKHAQLSEKEYAREYRENNKERISEYQAEYRAKKREENEKSGKEDMLTAWYKLRSAINSNFDMLNPEEFERLNFEDMLIAMDDIQLENFVAKNPFVWQRANEYLKQKKQELVFQKFFAEEIDD